MFSNATPKPPAVKFGLVTTGQKRRRRVEATMMLVTLAISACGGFDNTSLIESVSANANTTCETQTRIVIETPILPHATRSDPWVGWLHGSATDSASGAAVAAIWTVEGLPAGLQLDTSNAELGLLSGSPQSVGNYQITATLTPVGCPALKASETFEFEVADGCADESCAVDCSGLSSYPTKMSVEVVSDSERRVIGKGESFGADDVEVINNDLLAAGSPTDRQLVLRLPESKNQLVVHYSLPGGVRVPLGERVDFRYIHGEHNDHYLFLSQGHLPQFVFYDGYLSGEELALQCPDYSPIKQCSVPDFQAVATDCVRDDGKIAVALSTLTGDGAGAAETRLLPGSGGPSGNLVVQVIDAWACPDLKRCEPDYPPLHRMSFFQIPRRPMVCGVERVDDGILVAPATASFAADIIYAESPDLVQFDWPVDSPMPQAQLIKDRTGGGDSLLTLSMPAVGTYTVRAKCAATVGGSQQEGFGTAELRVEVLPLEHYRIEFQWRAIGSSSVPGETPQLFVGPFEAVNQGPNFQGIDFPTGQPTLPIEVYYPFAADPDSTPQIQITTRVLIDGVVKFNETCDISGANEPQRLTTINADGTVEPKSATK
ncbi:MAG: hypothetical protein ACI9OJ_004719 [Myxococcota bacterium]|jgi:hypothetical protein